MMLSCRYLARAKISLIINIYAVCDRVEVVRQPKTLHHGEKLIFAMKTARSIVADVFRAIEFGGGDDFQRDSLFPGKSNGVRQLASCQAGRIGDNRQHIVTQNLMGSPGEECGIHSAGVSHQSAAKATQPGVEGAALRAEIGAG